MPATRSLPAVRIVPPDPDARPVRGARTADALRVAERIRSTVEATRFEAARGESLALTVSVGVATYPAHGRSREELLDLSDKAMYRAKSVGRNRVCSAGELAG